MISCYEVICCFINDKFELPDGSYSVSYTQEYFDYILKKYGEKTDNPSIKIYIIKIESRMTFKFKTGYYLGPLTPEIKSSYLEGLKVI